ncbi:MAG: tetratricopeptide repeat protein [Bacteroidales bacterium]|nr:tetratricopeptide repeat protein [Bacteroidales bacterium]
MLSLEEIIKYDKNENARVFHNLLSRCKSGYAVPYIGAGLSMFVGLPLWNGFLSELKEQCKYKNFDLDNPLVAADEIERQLGSGTFYKYFQKVFHSDKNDEWWKELIKKNNISQQAVSVIPRLFHGPIITSNYDKVIEAVHNFNIEVALPDEVKKLEDTNDEVKHLIYKVHGCVSQPEKIVFTGKSYENYYGDNPNHVRILSKFFKRFNLVFMGCSVNLINKDKPIELWEKLVSSGQQHYAILPCAESDFDKRRKELKEFNIFPIFYPEGMHDCVKTILEGLLLEKMNDSIKIPMYDQEKFPFVGRDGILDEIHSKLCNNSNILYLSGIGGVGKTRIACEYARLHKYDYVSGVFFFHAVSEEILFADIIQFARNNNLIEDSNIGKAAVYDKVSEWMINNDNWLFIFDNMEELNHVVNLLSIVSNSSISIGKRHFLITTRNRENSNSIVIVDTFSKEESGLYLFEITKETPNEYSSKIAEMLGWLPLALEQAASYITREEINYEEYYHLLVNTGLLETLKQGDCTDNTLAVNATYNLSIEKLSCEEIKQLLYIVSFFAPENIRIDWIRETFKYLDCHPDLCKKINDADELQKMIDELSSYSLIRVDNGKINIHRLTQAVVRKMLIDGDWLDICSKTMVEVFDLKNFDKPDSKSSFLETVPHMEQLFAIFENENQKVYTAELGQLYHIFMFGFDKIKEHEIALRYKDKTLEIRKAVANKKELAKTYNLIGVVYQNIGDYKLSLPFLKIALSLREEVFKKSGNNEDESFIAKTYTNIALHYYWIGEYKESEKFHKLAIKIKEKYGDLDDRAFSYNNIGALFETMSKCDNYLAMSYHQKAFEVRKNMENLVNLAFTLNNMGVIEKNLGNYKDALLYFNKALELREIVYGSDAIHPDIAQTYTNIADIYINRGELEEAKRIMDRAIYIYEVKLTDKHIETSKAYYNLAKWYYVQSMFNEAELWFKKVMDIRKISQSEGSEDDVKELERMIINCKKQATGESLLNGIG